MVGLAGGSFAPNTILSSRPDGWLVGWWDGQSSTVLPDAMANMAGGLDAPMAVAPCSRGHRTP